MSATKFQSGHYTGAMYDQWSLTQPVVDALSSVKQWINHAREIPSLGRHSLIRHELEIGGRLVPLAIKSFSRGSLFRDMRFRKLGSKAARSFYTAVRLSDRGVGTPRPLAFLDRWDGGRLIESYYLCEYQEDVTSFRDELNRLYAEDPLCRRIMTLLETVATAIADMHDAGVCHRDLGNQNILLRRDGEDAWKDIQFIDLNRAHIADNLSLDQRARDISRIDLPSDFLRVFKCMYFRHQHPPKEFQELELRYRKRFAFHTASRKYRHPVREARQRKLDACLPQAPRGRELWVWDDRSVQAVSTMISKDRHKYYPMANNFMVARGLFKAVHPVYSRYRDLMNQAYRAETNVSGRLGVAVGTEDGVSAQERNLIDQLGKPPVLIRLYRHEHEEMLRRRIDDAVALRKSGHAVFAALVQDRAGIRDPKLWRSFVSTAIPALYGIADWLEVGHAVNRVKWGIWRLDEYVSLLNPVLEVARAHGNFRIAGPAVIDFEFHYLVGLLDMIKEDNVFDALSLHLYVDRRGAPENRQGAFSAVEKFAMAKAIASWSSAVKGDRLIVSEVNWPLLDTGVYSPVCSPYTIPNSHTNDPSVSEDDYASFMVRYEILALCSGFVDSVYWWRLVARGFGLADDTRPEWRLRPAFHAFRHLRERFERVDFVEKMQTSERVRAFRFRDKLDGHGMVVAWAHPGKVNWTPDFQYERLYHRNGDQIETGAGGVELTGSPLYFVGVT